MKAFFAALFLLPIVCFAQQPVTTTGGKRSDSVNLKLHQLAILNEIVPLALTSKQINALLTAIEKARLIEFQTLEKEDNELASIDGKLTKAITSAIDQQQMPPKKLIKSATDLIQLMVARRLIALHQMTSDVEDVAVVALNKGQLKIMANSVQRDLLEPDKDTSKYSDTDKQRIFVERVFLDDSAYYLLQKIEKHLAS